MYSQTTKALIMYHFESSFFVNEENVSSWHWNQWDAVSVTALKHSFWCYRPNLLWNSIKFYFSEAMQNKLVLFSRSHPADKIILQFNWITEREKKPYPQLDKNSILAITGKIIEHHMMMGISVC